MFLMVVWIFLMMFWLFGGGYVAYKDGSGTFNFPRFGGYTLIPWLCVAIIGYKMFEGNPIFK